MRIGEGEIIKTERVLVSEFRDSQKSIGTFDIEKARNMAAKGSFEAQEVLGWAYYFGNRVDGNRVEMDYKEARRWFKKAALQEKGKGMAQYMCAELYDYGDGDEDVFNEFPYFYPGQDKREKEIFCWHIAAAVLGDMTSQCKVGGIFYNLEQFEEAYKWYDKAEKQGSLYAECMIGIMFYHGEGIKQNYEKAVQRFRSITNMGNIGNDEVLGYAEFYLSCAYLEGKGIQKNWKTGLEWMVKAAKHGCEEAVSLVKDLS